MSNLRASDRLILAIAPNTKGFGYVVVEAPLWLVDWGVREVNGTSVEAIRQSLNAIYARYRPKTCLCRLPKLNERNRTRSRRIAQAFEELAAREQAIHRAVESGDIAAFFNEECGAGNKDEVARAVATVFSELSHIVPGRRRAWTSEHRRMGMFDAAAAVIWYIH